MTDQAFFTSPHQDAEARREHARTLGRYEPTAQDVERWAPAADYLMREVCDGFRVPDQTVLVARDDSDPVGSSFLVDGGSSMTTNFWFGEPKACEEFLDTLIESSQRLLPTAGLNPQAHDRVLIGLWETPATGKCLVATLASGDWAAEEDGGVYEAADTLGLVQVAFGGNDNGVHNLLDEGILEDAEDDEAADIIETTRLASGAGAWEDLKGILEEDHADAFKIWKKRYDKKTPRPN